MGALLFGGLQPSVMHQRKGENGNSPRKPFSRLFPPSPGIIGANVLIFLAIGLGLLEYALAEMEEFR
jgi:hypothetical protein